MASITFIAYIAYLIPVDAPEDENNFNLLKTETQLYFT